MGGFVFFETDAEVGSRGGADDDLPEGFSEDDEGEGNEGDNAADEESAAGEDHDAEK